MLNATSQQLILRYRYIESNIRFTFFTLMSPDSVCTSFQFMSPILTDLFDTNLYSINIIQSSIRFYVYSHLESDAN